MKNTTLLFLLFVMVTVQLNGQALKGIGGSYSIGLMSLPTDNLQEFSENADGISDIGLTYGLNMYVQLNRFILGGGIDGFTGFAHKEANFRHNIYGWSFKLQAGYKVLYSEKNAIYPFAGIGLGSVYYTHESLSDVNLLTQPSPVLNTGTFNWVDPIIDFGLRWEHYYKFSDKKPYAKSVGLEVGYQFSPASANWSTTQGSTVFGGPDFEFTGWFAKFTFGGFTGKYQ